jgi:anti-sigma regulatory factor (Ser/Thr protein kinase)
MAAPPSPESLAEGGYGLFLINSLVDVIRYESSGGWNTLTLIKHWKENSRDDEGPHPGH